MSSKLTLQPDKEKRICPLCESVKPGPFYRNKQRDFFRCPVCNLVFVKPEQFLSEEAEKAEYDLHQNGPEDAGYRKFLKRLFIPMQQDLLPGSRGLDFGAGPGPTLSVMFEEIGHRVSVYDKFYAEDPALLERQYDFITATEVVEHLHDPGCTLDMLWGCLKPGGRLGIMTKLALDRKAFARWHYKNDPTHVCFFSQETFEWLAECWQATLTFIDKDVILLDKPVEAA